VQAEHYKVQAEHYKVQAAHYKVQAAHYKVLLNIIQNYIVHKYDQTRVNTM